MYVPGPRAKPATARHRTIAQAGNRRRKPDNRMPNGSPDFAETERPLLEQFFAPVAGCLEHFGLEHNLLLTRYWHQEPCWDFMFRHPLDGVGRIMIHKVGDDLLSVQGVWWVDRYDEFARYIRRSVARAV